jgi:5-methylcytosine-specific restriction endonuclease McrA
MDNLVTACQPCNLIKGKRVYKSVHEAKEFVLAKREEWRRVYREQTKPS